MQARLSAAVRLWPRSRRPICARDSAARRSSVRTAHGASSQQVTVLRRPQPRGVQRRDRACTARLCGSAEAARARVDSADPDGDSGGHPGGAPGNLHACERLGCPLARPAGRSADTPVGGRGRGDPRCALFRQHRDAHAERAGGHRGASDAWIRRGAGTRGRCAGEFRRQSGSGRWSHPRRGIEERGRSRGCRWRRSDSRAIHFVGSR